MLLLGGPVKNMCSMLNGPAEPPAENSQVPEVFCGTDCGPLVEVYE